MNEVTIYQQIADPIAAIKTLGNAIARSQIFGCQNEAQGEVLAMECMARRLPPLMLAERYHIIQGKLSMKADAMLAGFEESGGEYEIAEYSSEACSVIFKRGKSTITIRITWEDAQKEPWPWFVDKKTGQKVMKDTWSSPIGRQDLLWARVVSRGVRRLAPGVVCGRYTPEEIVDFAENQPTAQPVVKSANPPVVALKPDLEPEAEEAEFVVSSEPQNSVSVGKRCSEDQVKQIKDAIKIAAQTGIPDIATRVKAKLESSGLKLADLTIAEADSMLQAIKIKSLEQFVDLSLKGCEIPF